jgi:16S rRNA (guanine(966)-N(2))-methyltransferase RsmD
MQNNKVRIIGGNWRSRIIHFPAISDLRPTTDRIRETLFNWLGQDLTGKSCLDLFAGSGALGFEALSRGAEQVVMIENNRQAYTALQENATKLETHHLDLRFGDALKFLSEDNRRFDFIFVDPPFRKNLLPQLAPLLPSHLLPEGLIYLERDIHTAFETEWQIYRQGKAGQVSYQLLQPIQP